MSAPSILRHIHLPHTSPFHLAQALQTRLSGKLLTHKSLLSSSTAPTPLPPAPEPAVITFTPTPVYTLGRREHEDLAPNLRQRLLAPLEPPDKNNPTQSLAEIIPTLRGGQTTFHGPGQLVIYPILDLRSPFPSYPKGISPRCYIHLLESVTIKTLKRYGIEGVRTEDPGVWERGGERKIAALGVHLRRFVSSYGVGLNVSTDLRWFERIVACGLVGKGVVSMEVLRRERGEESEGLEIGQVGKVWVEEFGRGLFGEGGEERIRDEKVELEEGKEP